MSIITRGADLVYTFRFLRLLTTPFEKTKAFELGIIDKEGKRDKKGVPYIDTPEKKAAYTPFHRIVFNIKKLLAKAPGGSSKIASYAAALFLIKENYNVTDKNLDKILKESNIDASELLEQTMNWLILKDGSITPGTYKILETKIVNGILDEQCYAGDKIRIEAEANSPVGQVFGINIYEATHVNTNRKIYLSAGELAR
jgi:hypothetical protein